jgi:hypothetical protein
MSEPYRCLSYGGGVQSTAMLLASCHGDIPSGEKPGVAIFADTQWEPVAVTDGFIDWLADVGPLGDARVFVIVHDIEVARVIAHELHARLIQINQEHIARLV